LGSSLGRSLGCSPLAAAASAAGVVPAATIWSSTYARWRSARVGVAQIRVVRVGRADQSGQQGRLGEIEFGRRLGK
jgi:hypothetical protein